MKTYPSIPSKVIIDLPVIGFDKIDGSNVRAEWNAKSGWYKFGTRNRLVDASTDPPFDAIPALVEEYGQPVEQIFRELKWERGMAFFELHGVMSAFGQHRAEEHGLTLIDVNCHKRGIMGPDAFLHFFGERCEIAPVLFKGKLTMDIVEGIRDGSWPREKKLFEGVVFKQREVSWHPWMFKVKTDEWIEEAKRRYSDQPEILESML